MSTRNGLGDLLFGRTRGAILALLYGRADQSFYTRQIAREVDASVGAVQRELENLSKVGLIIRSSVGSQVFYQANRNAPIFREMQALVNKTIGIFSVLRSALHPLAKRVLVAFVYGSVAREEETAQSDVDLMVVGKATLDEILSRLSSVEKNIGRPINPTVYSVEEFKSKLASGNHFLTAVLKGQKEFLLGDEDELRKVGGVRLAKAGADHSQDLVALDLAFHTIIAGASRTRLLQLCREPIGQLFYPSFLRLVLRLNVVEQLVSPTNRISRRLADARRRQGTACEYQARRRFSRGYELANLDIAQPVTWAATWAADG